MRHTSRSRPAVLALALAGALVALAACGSTSGEAAPSAAPASSSQSVFPVTLEHKYGTTTVDAEPTRIVTAGATEQDTVLALGVVPVGITEWYGEQPYAVWPWAQDELGDATPTVLSSTDGLQFEQIAALRPDLIIATNAGLTADDYTKLSAIAPTVAQSGDYSDYFEPWDVQALAAGTAMGRAEDITEIIDDVKGEFASAAAEHPEFDGTKAIFLQNAFYEGEAIAYQSGLSTDFLTDLGFVVPTEIDEFASADGGQAYIPLEQLKVLDSADVLLWATEAATDRAALEKEPIYRKLKAVEDGSLVFTDSVTAGAIYFTSVLSLPYVLEQLVPAFASTLAGEGPATTTS